MHCTLTSSIVFFLLSLIYGSAFAGNAQGLKTFSPGILIALRMLFGAIVCTIIFIIRSMTQTNYWNISKSQFSMGYKKIFWVIIAGLCFHGVPHCMIAISQQWVSSAAVQIAQPLSSTAGMIFSHFLLDDEKFDKQKLITIIMAFSGVGLTSIPSFNNAQNNTGQVAIGYILLIIAVSFFGVSPVILKWGVSSIDITVCAVIQTWASFIVSFLWSLVYDGPSKVKTQAFNSPMSAYMWPALVGTFATGIASHGFVYLISIIGANGANFITFGQILVGVILGVSLLGEWSKYKTWETAISIVGILLIIVAIAFGFYNPETEHHEEEEFDDNPNIDEL